jgi:adenine-specific DNA-methyltransferase
MITGETYDVNQVKQEHVKRLELEIDKLVYKLYGLTEEEVKIMEGNI